ncbi:MAG: hypothetical protein L6Q95_15465 [Planctomycetes bacterium]|nr:hypothetical protein [Planctomycetota bacterium]
MRSLSLLFLFAACSSPEAGEARTARWEIDGDGSYAVALCPHCDAPVAHDGRRCAGCGAAYRVEPTTVECPECLGTAHALCEACEGTGKCPICEGSGDLDGATCPECGGGKGCPDCAGAPAHACGNCLGKGSVKIP